MTVQSISTDSIRTLLATAASRLAQFQPGVVSDRPYYEGRVAALYDLGAIRGDVAIASQILHDAEDALRFASQHHLSERTTRYLGGRIHAVRDALRRGAVEGPVYRAGYYERIPSMRCDVSTDVTFLDGEYSDRDRAWQDAHDAGVAAGIAEPSVMILRRSHAGAEWLGANGRPWAHGPDCDGCASGYHHRSH